MRRLTVTVTSEHFSFDVLPPTLERLAPATIDKFYISFYEGVLAYLPAHFGPSLPLARFAAAAAIMRDPCVLRPCMLLDGPLIAACPRLCTRS